MIKRSELATQALAALMSGVMFLSLTTTAGCVADADGGPTQEAAPGPTYDGQTAFRGVFFGEGVVAQVLPEIWGDSAARGVKSASALSAAELSSQLEAAIKVMKAEGWSEEHIADVQRSLDTLQSGGTLPDRTAEATTTHELIITRLAERDPTFFERFAVEIQSGDHVHVQNIVAEARVQLTEIFRTLSGDYTHEHRSNAKVKSPIGLILCIDSMLVTNSMLETVAIAVRFDEPMPGDRPRLKRDEIIDHLTKQLGPNEAI